MPGSVEDSDDRGIDLPIPDLPLDSRDMVYFSRHLDLPGAAYGVVAREEGITALDEAGLDDMHLLSFITESGVVDRILRHVGWRHGAQLPGVIRPPPEVLMVAESPA